MNANDAFSLNRNLNISIFVYTALLVAIQIHTCVLSTRRIMGPANSKGKADLIIRIRSGYLFFNSPDMVSIVFIKIDNEVINIFTILTVNSL